MRNTQQSPNVFERTAGFILGVCGAFAALFLNRRPAQSVVSRRAVAVAAKEGPVTVLAIDDDAAFLDAVSEILKQKGWGVLTATSAARGLELLQHTGDEIDVVLLDYNMPVLAGDVALEHLRKICPDMKVIGATGVEVQELPVSFREGVDDILGKPFGSRDLIGCIRSLVNHPEDGLPASSAA